jgi:hypothetical protein
MTQPRPLAPDDAVTLGILALKSGIEVIPDETMPEDEIWLECDGKVTHRIKVEVTDGREIQTGS